MNEQRRHAITTPGERPDPARRGPASVLVSVAIHIVAIAVLVRVAIVPFTWFDLSSPARPQETHVDYLRTAADSGSRQRSGGDNRRVNKGPAPVPIEAPSSVPSTLPPEPPKNAKPVTPGEGGLGAIVGAGGPTRGVTPAFTDPRLWAPNDPVPIRPKNSTERLDSAISSMVLHVEDSLRAMGVPRANGDWTVNGKDGKKYGIDQKYIHLGNFSIPTALLALLPLNVQGNPSTYENARRIEMIRAEILEATARSQRDEDFNKAVRDLRARKQKERADKAKADATLPEAPPVKIVPQP